MPDFLRKRLCRCSVGAFALNLGLLLSACGSSAGPTPIPAPTPSPTPTPTPTPPPPDAGLIKGEFDGVARTYSGSSAGIAFQRDEGTGRVTDHGAVVEDPGDVTVRYNGPNDYTLTYSGVATHDFAPANRLPDNGEFKVFQKSVGYHLYARLSVVDPNKIDYRYMSWGRYAYDVASLFGTAEVVHYFIAGMPTPASSVPKTGSASYSGGVYGVWNGQDGIPLQFENSSSTLAANFGDGTVVSTLILSGRAHDAGGQAVGDLIPLGTFVGSGRILATINEFSGAYPQSEPGSFGAFQGAFYGPGAEEAGLSFALESPDHSAVGVAFGKKN